MVLVRVQASMLLDFPFYYYFLFALFCLVQPLHLLRHRYACFVFSNSRILDHWGLIRLPWTKRHLWGDDMCFFYKKNGPSYVIHPTLPFLSLESFFEARCTGRWSIDV